MSMNILTLSWHMRPLVILFAVIAGIFYVRGWLWLRKQPPDSYALQALASPGLLSIFFASLLLLLISLVSPLDYLATQFFFLGVAQHLLLLTLIPCLFFIPNPLPFLWYGMPASWRAHLRQQRETHHHWPERLRRVTGKGPVLLAFVAAAWLWYDPTLHQTTLDHPWLRDLALLSLAAAGALYWWHITAATPRLHQPLPRLPHIAYTAIGALPIKISGLFFLFTEHTEYNYPTPALPWLTITPLESYHLGGAVTRMVGGVTFTYAAVWLLSQWLDIEEKKPWQPRAAWDTPEAMLAPGINRYEV